MYEVVDGRDVSQDNEIVISKGYAVNMKVNIGDKLKIMDKNYTVTDIFCVLIICICLKMWMTAIKIFPHFFLRI